MERKAFQTWLSAIDTLSEAQKTEVGEVLAGRPVGEASSGGRRVECWRRPVLSPLRHARLRWPTARRGECSAISADRAMRTFGAVTGTPLSGLHHKDVWLTFGECLANGDTVAASAKRCGIAVSTAFRWRHRFLAAIETDTEKLRGIVEADETFVLESRKGDRSWSRAKEGKPSAEPPARKARKRGGKATKRGLSDEQVPVLVATDRSGATVQRRLAGGQRRGPAGCPCAGHGQGCAAGDRRRHPLSSVCRRHGCQPRGAQPVVRRTRSRGTAYPDRQQPALPSQGVPSQPSMHRDEISCQLSALVPSHCPSSKLNPTLLSRQCHGRHDCRMINTNHE